MKHFRTTKRVRRLCGETLRSYGENAVLYFDHREGGKYAAVYYDMTNDQMILVESHDVSAPKIELDFTKFSKK